MKSAIERLEASLDTLVANGPIHRLAGNHQQADIDAAHASEIRHAIAVLKSYLQNRECAGAQDKNGLFVKRLLRAIETLEQERLLACANKSSRPQEANAVASGPSQSGLVELPTDLKETISKLLHAAWRDGFDAEDDGAEAFFDGYGVARELLDEPRRVCARCHARLCNCSEDDLCQECWDTVIAKANALYQSRIAAGWTYDPVQGLQPPSATAPHRVAGIPTKEGA